MTTPCAISDLDLERLLKHYQANHLDNLDEFKHLIIINFLACCGLRVGEVVKLQWRDIMLCGEPNVSVVIRCEISKNGRPRAVPMTCELRKLITSFHRYKSGGPCLPEDYVFTSRYTSGNHLTVRAVQLHMAHHSHVALGYSVTPHQLRHTFATRMMRVTSSRIVQELLGHTQLSSTQIYMNPTTQDLIDATAKLEPPKI